MGGLDGKVALVTGASSGIGRAIALCFAAAGASVGCASSSDRSQETAAVIGDAAIAIRADVSVTDDVVRMVQAVEDRWGRLDVLVNSAGFTGHMRPLAMQTEENFDRVVAVNLRGVFLGMKYGIQAMLRHGGGSIVNVSSVAGIGGWKANGAYSAAKAGVVNMTRTAALDYGDEGVRVNALAVGRTWTPMMPKYDGPVPPDERLPQPMRRWGLPAEIAAAALFLASDEASYVTGAVLPVDGGLAAGYETSPGAILPT